MTDHDEISMMVAAYALDALDPADAALVSAHVARCDRCARAYAEALETVAALAAAVGPVEPPAPLRERILSSLPPVAVDEVAARRARRSGIGAWRAATAIATVAAAAAAILLIDQRRTIDALQADHAAVAAAGPLAVISGSTGRHVLLATLADAPAGHVYQVWAIAPGATAPVSLGLVSGGSTLRLTRPLVVGTTIAITVEPSGGSPAPTTAPVATVAI